MPKSKPPTDPSAALLQELRTLDHRLRELAPCDQEAAARLCLVRSAGGLDAAAWLALKREHGLEHWTALPARVLERQDELAVRLSVEIDRSRQCAAPLALALVQADTLVAAAGLLAPVLAEQARSFDLVAELDAERVAVVFSGAALMLAERLAGSMLRRLRQALPGQDGAPGLCSAGIVGYGGCVALTPAELIARAQQSLDLARQRGGNRLEVAPPLDVTAAPKHSLVGSREKHFLFTGKRMPEK